MAYQSELSEPNNNPAFGETLGIEVPTRYDIQTHATLAGIMAADTMLTPAVFGMSSRTVWFCRMVGGLLLYLRTENSDLTLRKRLQIEAATGVGLLILSMRGTVTRRPFENAYLFIYGILLIGHSLMTQVDS